MDPVLFAKLDPVSGRTPGGAGSAGQRPKEITGTIIRRLRQGVLLLVTRSCWLAEACPISIKR
jgi:hypothetical protein